MTGVQWAVLLAYSQTLPSGPERMAARLMIVTERPPIGRQGVALLTASALGFLHRGRITASGEAAARAYLARRFRSL